MVVLIYRMRLYVDRLFTREKKKTEKREEKRKKNYIYIVGKLKSKWKSHKGAKNNTTK